jgi:hypothetical protein
MKKVIVATVFLWSSVWCVLSAQSDPAREVDRLKRNTDWFVRQGLPMEGYAFDDSGINTHLSMARHWRRQEVRRKNWAWVAVVSGALISGTALLTCASGTDGSGCQVGGQGIPFLLGLGTGITLRVMSGVSSAKKDASLDNANALLMR